MARPPGVNWLSCAGASLASASHRYGEWCWARANAHAVFAMPCADSCHAIGTNSASTASRNW
eukprot:scaffold10719_cov101-Isochrysis_galbana.AAC.4